jgi:tetratricopeptide (TPR) repeat protein
MRIFISYASEEGEPAKEIALALRGEGHDVFLDRSQLPEGDAYNARIRQAIRDCDLLVFLVSPEALSAGRYTLTELKFAEEKWPRPAGHLLPVMVKPMDKNAIPAFLRSVTLLQPGGNVPAEVVAAVDRLARPWWADAGRRFAPALAVLAALSAGYGGWRAYEHWHANREALGLLGQCKVQEESGNYAAAWECDARAAVAAPWSDAVAQAQERLAMDWLDNIRVTEGKQTFTDVVNTVQPVLARGAVSPDDRRAANALAHLGWADFLRSRDGAMGLDPPHYYRQALQRDPQNVYAHAMWGHDLIQRGGSVEEAKAHFANAVATGEQRPYVRDIQIAALMWRDDPDLENELVRVANGMRTQGEARPGGGPHDSAVWRLWNVYNDRLINGTDKASFLAAVPPADQLATFRWLYPEETIPKDKRPRYQCMLAQLQEQIGDRAAALATYRALLKTLAAEGGAGGRLFDDARQAVTRLERE